MYSYSPPISLLKPDLSWGFRDTQTYFASIAISVVRFTPNLAPRWTLRPKLPLMSPVWAGACHGFGSLCADCCQWHTQLFGSVCSSTCAVRSSAVGHGEARVTGRLLNERIFPTSALCSACRTRDQVSHPRR